MQVMYGTQNTLNKLLFFLFLKNPHLTQMYQSTRSKTGRTQQHLYRHLLDIIGVAQRVKISNRFISVFCPVTQTEKPESTSNNPALPQNKCVYF